MEESITGVVPDFASAVQRAFLLEKQDIKSYSPLTLAYLGDAVYELIVRTMLVEKANMQVNKLHQKASSHVKASAQKDMIFAVLDLLTEEEMSIYKRGRNAKSFTSAKNATIGDYRIATGFEALIGYLYLLGKTERILELVKIGMERRKCGNCLEKKYEESE